MSSLFSLYHSVRTLPMWQDIWFINCYFVIGFRWKDDGKQVIASQAGSTVSTPHPQNWSLIGSHRWRGGKLSHFDRSFFCHNEMPTKLQRPGRLLWTCPAEAQRSAGARLPWTCLAEAQSPETKACHMSAQYVMKHSSIWSY